MKHTISAIHYPAGAGRLRDAAASTMSCSCGWTGGHPDPEQLRESWIAHRRQVGAPHRTDIAWGNSMPGFSFGKNPVV